MSIAMPVLTRLSILIMMILISVSMSAGWGPVGSAKAESGSQPSERELPLLRVDLLAALNQERRRAGLPPFKPNTLLDRAAQGHARFMADRGILSHEGANGSSVSDRARAEGYVFRRISENVAQGQPDVPTVVRGWMNSPGHRRNILDPDADELGVGYARGRSGRSGAAVIPGTYWVMVAGARFEENTSQPSRRELAQLRSDLLRAVNAERRRAGLAPLKADAQLDRIALSHAEYMAVESRLSHEGAGGSSVADRARSVGYPYRRITENVAQGYDTVEAVVAGWMKSPGHRRNILDADVRDLGTGFARGRNVQSEGTVIPGRYWVMVAGTRQGAD